MVNRNKVLSLHPLPDVLKAVELEFDGIDSDVHQYRIRIIREVILRVSIQVKGSVM